MFRPGDIVRYAYSGFGDEHNNSTGIVIESKVWKDPGNPNNVGVDVSVMWPDGKITRFDELELELIEIAKN